MKKLLLLLLALVFLITANAQDDKTVTLIVSGQGKSKDEAKQSALRSAIEQAFGTFISSKTEILNDILVKDQIISVSNGNIQNFEIISELQIPNGDYAISLKATVSVSKLSSFIESKGVSVEFKGSLFAFNVNQQILNEKNEAKAIYDLCIILSKISDISFDYTIKAYDPIALNSSNEKWRIPLEIKVNANKNISMYIDHIYQTLRALSLTSTEASDYIKLGKSIYPISFAIDKNKFLYAVLRNRNSISKIVTTLYYFNNSLLSFKINNGIQDFSIQSKPENINKIDDSNFMIFLGRHRGNRNVGYKCSVFHAFDRSAGSLGQEILVLNYRYWLEKREVGFGSYSSSTSGVDPMDYQLIFDDVARFHDRDNQFSFSRKIKKDIKNNLAGLVISFIGISAGTQVLSISYDDIRTLNEINRITEYKIVPIFK